MLFCSLLGMIGLLEGMRENIELKESFKYYKNGKDKETILRENPELDTGQVSSASESHGSRQLQTLVPPD